MEWVTLSHVEMADAYYGGIEVMAELAIDQEDVVAAQEVKLKICKVLLACLSSERTKPIIRMIGKYVRLDNKLCKFILMKFRAEFVNLDPQED